MRDRKRIPKILARLCKVWRKDPDIRPGQLFENVFYNPNNAMYFMEDEGLIKTLEAFYEGNPVMAVGGQERLQTAVADWRKKINEGDEKK